MAFTISINEEAAFEVLFAGPAGPTGPQGIQGIQGVPGPGVAAGGTTGQVLKKLSSTNYDTGWSSDISGVAWGGITGTLSSQTDLQTALDAKLSTSVASSTYLPLAGGYITGDIQSLNGSEFRTFQSPNSVIIRSYQIQMGDAVGSLTVDAGGITFNSSPYKQTLPFLGLAGYATESWVTTNFYPLTGNPSGFLTASALTPYSTTVQADALYYPLTGNPSAFLVAADLAGYATESWVTGELANYLPLSGGAMTGSITSTGTTYDTEMAGDFFGVQLSSDHTQGTMVNFDGLHTYDGPNSVYVKPTGITFPDSTVQTTAYAGLNATTPLAYDSGTNTVSISATPTFEAVYAYNGTQEISISPLLISVSNGGSNLGIDATGITFPDATMQTTAYTGTSPTAWGSITGTLSDQTDLQSALDAKYDANNPAGFVDSAYVTGLGYITQGTADGLYYSISNPSGFIGSSGGNITGGFSIQFDASGGDNYSIIGNSGIICQAGNAPYNDYVLYGLGGLTITDNSNFQTFTITNSGIKFKNNTVQTTAFTSSLLTPYALLSGATFTGKVNLATIGVSTPSINLGGQCDSAPASAANGDIWISNAVSPKLTYRMGGVNYNLPVLNQFNTFTNQMVIDTTSSSVAALRVTQRGAGNAIEVEDSTTPDATKFVVDQFGKVGVGTAPDATAAIKIDGNGISFNGLVFNPTATAAHTGGSDTLDLLVTINGTNYRLGLRPA